MLRTVRCALPTACSQRRGGLSEIKGWARGVRACKLAGSIPHPLNTRFARAPSSAHPAASSGGIDVFVSGRPKRPLTFLVCCRRAMMAKQQGTPATTRWNDRNGRMRARRSARPPDSGSQQEVKGGRCPRMGACAHAGFLGHARQHTRAGRGGTWREVVAGRGIESQKRWPEEGLARGERLCGRQLRSYEP